MLRGLKDLILMSILQSKSYLSSGHLGFWTSSDRIFNLVRTSNNTENKVPERCPSMSRDNTPIEKYGATLDLDGEWKTL